MKCSRSQVCVSALCETKAVPEEQAICAFGLVPDGRHWKTRLAGARLTRGKQGVYSPALPRVPRVHARAHPFFT